MDKSREGIIDFLNRHYSPLIIKDQYGESYDIWPIIRIKLHSLLIKKLEPSLSVNQPKIKYHRKTLLLSRLKAVKETLIIGKKEKLLLGAYSHRVEYKSKAYNRFFDPYLAANSIILEYDIKLPDNNYSPTINLPLVKSLMTFFFRPYHYQLEESSVKKVESIVQAVHEAYDVELLNFLQGIKSILKSMARWERIFEYFLKKTKAQEVVALCYYNTSVFGAFLAASKMGIKKVDLQHGPNTANHTAYGKWNFLSNKHNVFLPNEFWTWDNSSAMVVNDYLKSSDHHKAIVYGNDWIKHWERNPDSFDIPENINLYSLQPLSEPIPDFFWSYIKRTLDKGQTWWLRLHPRQSHLDYEKLKSKVTDLGLDGSVHIDKANVYPLPVVLKHTNLHFTMFSGTAIEAAMFGVHTFFLDKRANLLMSQYPELFHSFDQEMIEAVN